MILLLSYRLARGILRDSNKQFKKEKFKKPEEILQWRCDSWHLD